MDSPALLVLLSVAAVLVPLVFAWWLIARRATPKRRAASRHGSGPKPGQRGRPAAHD